MLGGMGNPLGAVVGGLMLGLLESLRRRLHLVAYKDAVAFIVILGVLFVDAAGPVRRSQRRAGLTCRRLADARRRRPAGRRDRDRGAAAGLSRRASTSASPRWSSSSALAVLGLNLLMGFAGQVSLGHAGFFGIGAYAVAIGADASRAAVAGCVAARRASLAALLAFVVGRPILRLKGHYLAVATLGFGMLIAMVLTNESRVDRRARRHAGAAAGAVRLARRAARDDLVLDHRRDAGARRLDRAQPRSTAPTGRALARAARQRGRGARASASTSRATSCIAFVHRRRSMRAVAGALLALFERLRHAGHGGLPALDRIRDDGGAGRPRLDRSAHRRRRAAECCRRC